MDSEKNIIRAFDYAKEQGLSAFIQESKYYRHLEFFKKGFDASNLYENMQSINSKDSLLYEMKGSKRFNGFDYSRDKNFRTNFFIDTYMKIEDAEERKELLKEMYSFLGYSWNQEAKQKVNLFLEKVTNNDKDLLELLNSFPISILEAHSIDFEKVDELFSQRKASSKDVDKFWFKFFKTRKNQIKYPTVGPVVAKFLVNKYNRDRTVLEPYFAFSNHVRTEFEEIDFDLVEKGSPHLISFKINCKKAALMLCIPGHGETRLHNEINNFLQALKTIKSWDKVKSNVEDKDVYEYSIYSSEYVSRDDVIQSVRDFLSDRKSTPETPVNENTVASWLMNKELRVELTNSKEEVSKAKKIKI